MEEKIVRIKTSPKIAYKRNSIFPESRYYNKLYNNLSLYTKAKNIGRKFNDIRLLNDEKTFELFKNEINDIFIKIQCKLHNLPIKLYGNKYIETDFLEPYWDKYCIEKSPKYVIISKKYILLNIDEAYNIIEYRNWQSHKEGKKVKIYKLILPQGYEIIYE